jgi:hypothetical protein
MSIGGELAFTWQRLRAIGKDIRIMVCVGECIGARRQCRGPLVNECATSETLSKVCEERGFTMTTFCSQGLFFGLNIVSIL